MTYDELQKRYEWLVRKATKTRKSQVAWEDYHIKADRKTKLRHERELDQFLIQENKRLKAAQKEMF